MRLLSAIIVTLLCAIGADARLTARQAFEEAPNSVLPLLAKSQRLDMADYFEAGMTSTTVKNRLDGDARITEMTERTLTAELGEGILLQVELLTAKNDTIMAWSETLATPEPDTEVRFFTRSWQPVDSVTAARRFKWRPKN